MNFYSKPWPYPTLETERLLLTPLTSAEADDLFPVYSDPETMRHMHIPPAQTTADVLTEIKIILAPFNARHWAIRLRSDPRALGVIGLVGSDGPIGIGYILHRDYWGQGIVPEALTAVIDFGFTSAEIGTLELWIDTANMASIRVANKLGFKIFARRNTHYPHRSHQHEMTLMALSSAEWHKTHLP